MDTATMILIYGLFALMFLIQVMALVYQHKENARLRAEIDNQRERLTKTRRDLFALEKQFEDALNSDGH